MSERCNFPECPSGQGQKLQDERHEEIKVHLMKLEASGTEMLSIVRDVSTLLADTQHLIKDVDRIDKDHNEIFLRLRKVEKQVVWLLGGVSGIVTLMEILKLFHVIK